MLPCPFCGSEEITYTELQVYSHFRGYVVCTKCGGKGPDWDLNAFPKSGKDKAIEDWNKRK